jgi:DNA-binding Lrp family transcriptional regulator
VPRFHDAGNCIKIARLLDSKTLSKQEISRLTNLSPEKVKRLLNQLRRRGLATLIPRHVDSKYCGKPFDPSVFQVRPKKRSVDDAFKLLILGYMRLAKVPRTARAVARAMNIKSVEKVRRALRDLHHEGLLVKLRLRSHRDASSFFHRPRPMYMAKGKEDAAPVITEKVRDPRQIRRRDPDQRRKLRDRQAGSLPRAENEPRVQPGLASSN